MSGNRNNMLTASVAGFKANIILMAVAVLFGISVSMLLSPSSREEKAPDSSAVSLMVLTVLSAWSTVLACSVVYSAKWIGDDLTVDKLALQSAVFFSTLVAVSALINWALMLGKNEHRGNELNMGMLFLGMQTQLLSLNAISFFQVWQSAKPARSGI